MIEDCPEQPCTIIDSHVHFWTKYDAGHHWLRGCSDVLYADLTPSSISVDMSMAGVSSLVLVQSGDGPTENQRLTGLANEVPAIAAVVGNFEEPPRNDAEFRMLIETCPKWRGVRVNLRHQGAAGKWLCRQGERALEMLRDLNLSLDILAGPDQLALVRRLAVKHDRLQMILDHALMFALRPRSGQIDIGLNMSQRENLTYKISGVDLRAYSDVQVDLALTELVKSFGPDRLMWGSDWPILNQYGDYASWFHKTSQIVRGQFGGSVHRRVFCDTAARVYRI